MGEKRQKEAQAKAEAESVAAAKYHLNASKTQDPPIDVDPENGNSVNWDDIELQKENYLNSKGSYGEALKTMFLNMKTQIFACIQIDFDLVAITGIPGLRANVGLSGTITYD